jgi:hypothetical protein
VIDVNIYLGSLPKIKNHNVKQEVMMAFAEGARQCGATVKITQDRQLEPSRLAVMIGWCGHVGGGPHIMFRQNIVDYQRQNNNRVMPIDGSCFKFVNDATLWLRYSIDSIFYNEGNYANLNSSGDRWREISSELGIELEPWRAQGNHVLICLQRDGGWSSKGFDQDHWLRKTIKQIRSQTTRPIMIRPHPSAKKDYNYWSSKDNIFVSDSTKSSLHNDLKGAHAAVFWNSSSAVAAILAGIPVFVSDISSVAWTVANHDVRQIESPIMPDRQQWIWDLSAAHWSMNQSRRGRIYRAFEQWL